MILDCLNNLFDINIINGITIIKYSNGIMEQFGFIGYDNNRYVKFPTNFSSKVCPMVHITPHSSIWNTNFSIRNPDNVGFYISMDTEPSTKKFFFRAIGFWK